MHQTVSLKEPLKPTKTKDMWMVELKIVAPSSSKLTPVRPQQAHEPVLPRINSLDQLSLQPVVQKLYVPNFGSSRVTELLGARSRPWMLGWDSVISRPC